jgi:uncharacterized RDD family membrane protein YckC
MGAGSERLDSSQRSPKTGTAMNSDQAKPYDPYAIAALTQRTPGFGFDISGVVQQRGLVYASILSRFFAALIDGVVTSVAVLFIVFGLFAMDRSTGGNPAEPMSIATLLILLVAILAFLWLYNVLQETSGAQATLGKRMLGIKVARISGDPISVMQSTIRLIVKIMPGGNPLLGLISFVADIVCLVMNSSTNRTVHDLIAGTIVING